MHVVRVHLNAESGTRWWAEDDLGFTGGADRLSELIDSIREWAEAESVLDQLAVRLVDTEPAPPPGPQVHFSGQLGPRSSGDDYVDIIRVGFEPVALHA